MSRAAYITGHPVADGLEILFRKTGRTLSINVTHPPTNTVVTKTLTGFDHGLTAMSAVAEVWKTVADLKRSWKPPPP